MKKWIRVTLLALSAALLMGGSAFAADEIKVLVNDEPIVFTDVQPEAKDGRTYIPMRATFNALGFEDENIVWDADNSEITASREELTIALKLGEKKVSVTEDGVERVIETDAAPYAAKNRTYVPVRFVAEAAGCKVGWDAADRTVLIDDIDAILAANDETYEIMNQYLDYGRKYSKGNIAMKGDLGMSIALADTMSLNMGGEFDAISNLTEIEMDMDLEMLMDLVYPGEDGQNINMQENVNLSVSACGDVGAGVLYFKSDELTSMMGMEGDVWFKMDMNALMSMEGAEEMVGMDYNALMELSQKSLDMTFEESIAAALEFVPLTDDEATAKDILNVLNLLCADSAFTKDGSDYISVLEIENSAIEFVLHSAGGKVNGFAMSMQIDGQEVLIMEMQDNEVIMLMQLIDDENGVGLEMTFGAAYRKSSKAPKVEPPKNAVILDLFSMMEIA